MNLQIQVISAIRIVSFIMNMNNATIFHKFFYSLQILAVSQN